MRSAFPRLDMVRSVPVRYVSGKGALADAADDARWFTAGNWQWGGRTVHHMQETEPGEWICGP